MDMKYRITQSRLIYVLSMEDKKHNGLLKVGEVFVDNDVADKSYSDLDCAVREILDPRSYMKDVEYKLEHIECTTLGSRLYKAADVHQMLVKQGYKKIALRKIDKAGADIWFECTKEEVLGAIAAVKKQLTNGSNSNNRELLSDINFRPEQDKAIKDTIAHFSTKEGKAFLWNAKMRFGKTLSGLQVARAMGYKSTLIVTHRPVVDKGWHEDFEKIFLTPSAKEECPLETVYATRMSDDDSTGGDFYQLTKAVDEGKKRLVFFVSMQYLRLSQFVGGKERNFDPLKKAIMLYDWDFVMVDEAHEGIEAAAGKRVMEKLTKENTRILSLSGTPFNLLDKYKENEIYTWDYVMEQKAKLEWDDKHFGDPNPYAELPRMQILTFTLPKMVREEKIQDNEGFKFHEFFRVWTEADRQKLQNSLDKEDDPLRAAELKGQLAEVNVDHFVHEADVKRFLDKLVEESDTSQYPFSNEEFIENFKHTFWLLPGVKEAKALEQLLLSHHTFGKDARIFHIINVAGDGNIEDPKGAALKEVENHIRGNVKENIPKKERTITLSCGKLTTGVSVPEWTAVLCMKGSENTPAANYMQTIFRVQTHAVLDGHQKSDCYVFDFAPDRALTAVAETAKMAVYAKTEKGKKQLKLSQREEELQLEAFIKLCPVLSMDEGEMGRHISANQIFEKLSNVYIERAVRSGYADNSLYCQEKLLDLTPEQEKALGDVHELLGSMPASWKPDKIGINKNGIGDTKNADDIKYIFYLSNDANPPQRPAKSALPGEDGKPTTEEEGWCDFMNAVSQLFPYLYVSNSRKIEGEWTTFSNPVLWKEFKETNKETDSAKKEREKENKEKRARMSVLRGVAIRIPLLVYGAEINDEVGEEITIDNFASEEIVDQASWDEFMPKGFTKETFNILKDCFDRAIFTGAAKRIRAMVKEADNLNTEDRIAKIATIFSYFHNPDKETVLTPWSVVNRHLSDTLGGWCFMNEQFDDANVVENQNGETIRVPRFVDRGEVTNEVFCNYNARILEINSKTGLYPLYMAYSIFKCAKEPGYRNINLTGDRGNSQNAEQYNRQAKDDLEIWKDVLQDNIFVVCRTKMAVSITKRTLAGFRDDIRMNVRCYEHDVEVSDLIKAGVLKKDDEGMTYNDKTYRFNGHHALPCDMIDVLRSRPDFFQNDVVRGNDYWHVYNNIPKSENENINNMKFTAIVGNPPYQLMGGSGGNNDSPLYQYFATTTFNLKPSFSTLIMPSRWFAAGRENLLGDFRKYILNCGKVSKLITFADGSDVFDNVEIKGGICYYLYEEEYSGLCEYSLIKSGIKDSNTIKLNKFDILIRDPKLQTIVESVLAINNKEGRDMVESIISADTPFGIPSNPRKSTKTPFDVFTFESSSHDVKLFHIEDQKRKIEYVRIEDIKKNRQDVDKIKVFVPGSGGSGNDSIVLGNPELAEKHSVCSQSYLYSAFNSEYEAKSFFKYLKTKFLRILVSSVKITQSAPSRVYQFVPLQDFTSSSDIDWSKPISDIDQQLYKKYGLSDEEQQFIEKMIKPMD